MSSMKEKCGPKWTNKVFVGNAEEQTHRSLALPLSCETWESDLKACLPSEGCETVLEFRLYQENIFAPPGVPAELGDTMHVFLVLETESYYITMEKRGDGIYVSYSTTSLRDFYNNRRTGAKISHRHVDKSLRPLQVLKFALKDCKVTIAKYDFLDHNCREFAHTIYRRFVPGPKDAVERFIFMEQSNANSPSDFDEVMPNWVTKVAAPIVTAPIRYPVQGVISLANLLDPDSRKPWFRE